MSKLKILFFFLFFLSLILCQNITKKQEPKEEKKPKEEPSKEKGANLNSTNHTSSHTRRRHTEPSLNLTVDEKDTLIFCAIIVQESMKKIQKEVDSIQKRLNVSNVNQIYDKIGTDIFEKCNKKMDIKVVNKYLKNLTLFNDFKWEKDFDEIIKIDPDKYANQTDLRYTMDQQVLMYKFNKVNEQYRQKRADQRENIEMENRKIRIGKLDMDSIPLSIKFGIFLVIIIIFFGGIFYFLKTLEKKPKDKKKKEKKKKIQ